MIVFFLNFFLLGYCVCLSSAYLPINYQIVLFSHKGHELFVFSYPVAEFHHFGEGLLIYHRIHGVCDEQQVTRSEWFYVDLKRRYTTMENNSQDFLDYEAKAV